MTARSRLMPVFLFGISACGSSTGPDPNSDSAVLDAQGELLLSVGHDVRVSGTVLRVTFTGVDNDSRCPVDVTCIWAGDAEIRLGLALGSGSTVPYTLHWNTAEGPASAETGSYRVTLVELLPEARSDTPIGARDFKVKLKIESL